MWWFKRAMLSPTWIWDDIIVPCGAAIDFKSGSQGEGGGVCAEACMCHLRRAPCGLLAIFSTMKTR